MLTNTEKATALEIVLSCADPEAFGATADRLCREFPTVTTDDLILLWREAGARQLAEAEDLERFARRRAMGQPSS